MIIGSSQASWVVAEGPFEVVGLKRLEAYPTLSVSAINTLQRSF